MHTSPGETTRSLACLYWLRNMRRISTSTGVDIRAQDLPTFYPTRGGGLVEALEGLEMWGPTGEGLLLELHRSLGGIRMLLSAYGETVLHRMSRFRPKPWILAIGAGSKDPVLSCEGVTIRGRLSYQQRVARLYADGLICDADDCSIKLSESGKNVLTLSKPRTGEERSGPGYTPSKPPKSVVQKRPPFSEAFLERQRNLPSFEY